MCRCCDGSRRLILVTSDPPSTPGPRPTRSRPENACPPHGASTVKSRLGPGVPDSGTHAGLCRRRWGRTCDGLPAARRSGGHDCPLRLLLLSPFNALTFSSFCSPSPMLSSGLDSQASTDLRGEQNNQVPKTERPRDSQRLAQVSRWRKPMPTVTRGKGPICFQ